MSPTIDPPDGEAPSHDEHTESTRSGPRGRESRGWTRRRTVLTAFGTALLGGIAGCTTGTGETATTTATTTEPTTTETTTTEPTTTEPTTTTESTTTDTTTTTESTTTDTTTTTETPRERPTTTTVASGFSVVDVTFTDAEMTLSTDERRPGRIRVDVNNRSLDDHHLYVVKTDLDPATLPRESDGSVATSELRRILDLQVGHGSRMGETQPFDAGEYVFFCDEPGHYEAGEFAEFLVR